MLHRRYFSQVGVIVFIRGRERGNAFVGSVCGCSADVAHTSPTRKNRRCDVRPGASCMHPGWTERGRACVVSGGLATRCPFRAEAPSTAAEKRTGRRCIPLPLCRSAARSHHARTAGLANTATDQIAVAVRALCVSCDRAFGIDMNVPSPRIVCHVGVWCSPTRCISSPGVQCVSPGVETTRKYPGSLPQQYASTRINRERPAPRSSWWVVHI